MNTPAIETSVAFLDSWLTYQADRQQIPGFVVAASHRNETMFSKAFGFADVENNEPLTTDHLFNIGSQAKMITATLIVQLAEQGQLDLDDRITCYLPWIAHHRDTRFRGITLRQLLWHGGGIIRDGKSADFWQLQAPFPDADALQQLVFDADLTMESGTRLKYSNIGYALLGQIIEVVSGMSYIDCAAKNIFNPLDMSTIRAYAPSLEPLITNSYTRALKNHRVAISKSTPTHAFTPVAGWYGTADDLLRFLNAFSDDSQQWMSNKSKQTMRRLHQEHWKPASLRSSDYGLGFEIHQFGKRQVFGHSGGFIGYRSCSFSDPVDQLTAVVLMNATDGPTMQLIRGLFGVFDHFAQSQLPNKYSHFNARLHNLWETMEIVATNERIVCIDPDSWNPFAVINEELTVESSTRLHTTGSDMLYDSETVEFVFDENKAIQHVNYAGTTAYPINTALPKGVNESRSG